MNIHKLIPLVIISTVFSQFYDVEVGIETKRIKNNQIYIIENLESEIENYFISNRFCSEYDFVEIDLKIQLIIESVSDNGNEIIISSSVLISNYDDQYFFSSIVFPYHRGKSLNFYPDSNESLTAFLNYYANLFIGYNLDTWGLNMGSSYLNKALDISDEMKFNRFPQDWEKRKDDIKDILENIKLRNIRFNYYHIMDSLDYGDISTEQINIKVEELYDDLVFIYEKIGYDKNTLKFLDSNKLQVANLCKSTNRNKCIQFLILFDEKNKELYNQFLIE